LSRSAAQESPTRKAIGRKAAEPHTRQRATTQTQRTMSSESGDDRNHPWWPPPAIVARFASDVL